MNIHFQLFELYLIVRDLLFFFKERKFLGLRLSMKVAHSLRIVELESIRSVF